MRADRLISLLLLLQQRKKITALELADELNVSIRTVYRDMTALSSSGFPVFAEKGPGGGCCIIEDFKSSIRTLSDAEVDSLQALRIPEIVTSLRAGQDLQRALLKVVSLIPERKRESSTLYIDWDPWNSGEQGIPTDEVHLLNTACSQRKIVSFEFSLLNKGIAKQMAKPYGIVAKSGEWYLVYKLQNKFRYKNIASLRRVQVHQDVFEKEEDFDLEAAWKRIAIDESSDRFPFLVRVQVKADQMELFGNSKWDMPFLVKSRSDSADEGWMDCEIGFEHLIPARGKLLSCGNAVRVISPEPLRLSMLDFARQVLEVNSEK